MGVRWSTPVRDISKASSICSSKDKDTGVESEVDAATEATDCFMTSGSSGALG